MEEDFGVADDASVAARSPNRCSRSAACGPEARGQRSQGAAQPAGGYPHVMDAFVLVEPHPRIAVEEAVELLAQVAAHHVAGGLARGHSLVACGSLGWQRLQSICQHGGQLRGSMRPLSPGLTQLAADPE